MNSNLILLALRNLSRNRARTLLTLSAIAFGVAMTILLSALGNGLVTVMANDVILAKVGALQVHRRGYAEARDNQPLSLSFRQDSSIIEAIGQTPGVQAVAPHLVFSGLVNNGTNSTVFVGKGVDPSLEYRVLPWAKTDVSGRALQRGDFRHAIFGSELASSLEVAGEPTLVIQAATKRGQQNALDVERVGTLNASNAFEAKRVVMVPLPFAQELLRMSDEITELVVAVKKIEDVEKVAFALQQKLGSDYEVETWQQLQPSLADIIRFQRVVVMLVALVFLVIVIFGVVNTMTMSVLERVQEIGTMMALGVRRRTISTLFVLEAAFVAVLGTGAGWLLATLFVGVTTLAGGFAVAPPGASAVVHNLQLVVFPVMEKATLVGAVIGAVLAALYPAWRAAKLRPVEALRSL